ncbi:hypothetical protein HC762_01115 [bacterium]|nr:hypothetical protein [bacterium]
MSAVFLRFERAEAVVDAQQAGGFERGGREASIACALLVGLQRSEQLGLGGVELFVVHTWIVGVRQRADLLHGIKIGT